MDTRQNKKTATRHTGKSTGKRPAVKTAGSSREKQPKARAAGATGTKTSRNVRPQKRVPVRQKRAAPERKREPQAYAAPEVVYTPPKPFHKGRFLLRLATIVAVVLALSFGISVFFRVENVTVSGAVKYDPWTIKEASGIREGDNLLSFGEAKAAGKIKTALPYVESVRIGIKLPNTVNIEIKELDVVYSIQDAAGHWWLITAEGKVVEKTDSAVAGEYTEIQGVTLASPLVGQQAVAQEAPPAPTDETAPPVTVRASDQLKAALTILQYLEECGIIGDVTSVDVTDLGNLQLWYGQRFLVKLGDTTQLLYKIKCMNAAINGEDKEHALKEYDSGVLDITFTIKENQVIYQTDEN